jgi:hypothetical protein
MSLPAQITLGAIATLAALAGEGMMILLTKGIFAAKVPMRLMACIASILGPLNIAVLMIVLVGSLRSSRDTMSRGLSWLLPAFGWAMCVVSSAVSLASIAWIQVRADEVPSHLAGAATRHLLIGSFVLFSIGFVAEGSYLTLVVVEMKTTDNLSESIHTEASLHNSSEMSEPRRPEQSVARKTSMVSNYSRASNAAATLRSSLYSKVRPITSKTRLLSRPASSRHSDYSVESSRYASTEDGFDSWDTSAVDQVSRQTITGSSLLDSQNKRFLETIPASPIGSRTPSPAFQPEPTFKQRNVEQDREPRPKSPVPSMQSNHQPHRAPSPSADPSNIHPLFRNSPQAAPLISPGTVLTAAPGAGQILSDRKSLASIKRMRSASNAGSPGVGTGPSSSTEGFPWHLTSDHRSRASVGSTRGSIASTITESEFMAPAIPDFILIAGARSSLAGYNMRKLNTAEEEESK